MMNTDKIFAESIANEYAPKDTSKVIALRKLDRKAKGPANIFAYSFGILMTLVLGLGMCLSMQVIGGGGVLMTGAGIVCPGFRSSHRPVGSPGDPCQHAVGRDSNGVGGGRN